MPMTSPFDDERTIEFFAGPWDGMRYTPHVGEAYPARLDMRWSGKLHHYVLAWSGDKVRFQYVGSALPDGAEVR